MEQNNITIRLLDGSLITLSPEQVELYPTIKDQTTDLVPGDIVDINYPNPKGLYQLLTNPNAALPFDLFLNMIEAADYVRNDDILNNLLVQMATTFTDKLFTDATTEIKENMINLVYNLPDTVLYRFLQLMKIIKLDYEFSPDPSKEWFESVFNNDLNTSLRVKYISVDSHRHDSYAIAMGAVFNKNIAINMFALNEISESPPVGFAIDNDGNVYGNIISESINGDDKEFEIDYPFTVELSPDDIDDSDFALNTFNRNEDYKSSVSLEHNFVAKLSQEAQRYAQISNMVENPENPEDPYAHFSIVQRTDNKSLVMFNVPRGKYKRETGIGGIQFFSGTKFPSVSPQMKIVIWRMPKDITNSRYRITAIDLPQKPTFFIDNIDFLGIPPTIFQNWPVGEGYILFNSEEDKLLLVRKTIDGHDVSLMTDRGEVLTEHLFTAEVPLLLVNDMIITVSDQMGDIAWGEKIPGEAVIDENTRFKIWYTRDITKPIPVYDNTFVPEVEGYTPWSIGKVYTGIKDSILLTFIYRKIDNMNIDKYVYRKYNVGSYQNMPEFFEDKIV